MNTFADKFSENDLKCDFPARESFREALLKHLLSMDKRKLEQEKEPFVVELSDSDLDLVAAAQGESSDAETYIKNKLGIKS